MYEFKMPSLGSEMEAGKLVDWKVKIGDRVKKHDIIAIVETDKSAIEIECWQSGVVEKLVVNVGEKVPVGTLLALIREDSPNASTPVDLKVDFPKLLPIVKSVAALMAKSKKEIPHYYLSFSIEMNKTLAWLEEYNKNRLIGDRIIYAALLIKSVALALKEYPEFNGFWINDDFQLSADINVGIVISLRRGGLLAPAIRRTDQLSLSELMKNMNALITRAREGSLRSTEVEGQSISVTNLGEYGVDCVFGIIYPPQVAIVGFGKINSQKIMVASLAADHRVSDGHRGSQFLTLIGHYLQAPEKL
jgi:pyruvate dehydrogenase E2 component (dihydrolipoamide acetyltransferase)